MNSIFSAESHPHRNRFAIMGTVLFLFPHSSQAATGTGPLALTPACYAVTGTLLVVATTLIYFLIQRNRAAGRALKDITQELDGTRKRLSDTTHELELSQKELKTTTTRFQGMLKEASVGMFQLDQFGRCIYVNDAMQEISGLYPKKAAKEGIASAVHPDDRPGFEQAWKQFTENGGTFSQSIRFQFKRGREMAEVHAHCQANRILNAKQEAESYVGWVTDVSLYQEQLKLQQAETSRFSQFVNETVEGYYRLVPEHPVSLTLSPARTADAILERMKLADCNDTFAAMYGTRPDKLEGKTISELHDGCGPFRTKQDLVNFIEGGFRISSLESNKQDPAGNRLNLINDVVGIVEDNKLVGIWGIQRNISQQKREKAELKSQVQFMQRILNVLPADVHVKDTRCRYLYASKKLAERTGINQEEWVGKTIFEVIPGTPREHDQSAIETMKSAKLNRTERPFGARGKSGWMETVQIPLVSEEGLVEGVVGLSLDITDRKKREEESRQKYTALESVLQQTRNDLNQSRMEYGKTATALADSIQKLKVTEAEKLNREHEFREHIAERKQAEESLRRSEETLLARQQQLEEHIARLRTELADESDKRSKWEELLSIKEEALEKAEILAEELGKQLSESEDFLQSTQEQLIQITEQHTAEMEKEATERKNAAGKLAAAEEQLAGIETRWNKDMESLKKRLQSDLDTQQRARTTAEKQLAKTEDLLHRTQEEMKALTEQHARELEQEVSERKTAAEKLIKGMEELDELRQQFHLRIDEETKAIKQELAQKQIREKSLRQHEKVLEERIKELEGMLQAKAKEFAEQMQALESTEVQKKQLEQRLEQMTRRQAELVSRETQKLQLHIAEIRLDEIKLRKQAGDLQREKETLEDQLQQRSNELDQALRQRQNTEAQLEEAQTRIQQMADGQSDQIAAETDALNRQVADLKQQETSLAAQLKQLAEEKKSLQNALTARKAELDKSEELYRQATARQKETETSLKQLADNQSSMLKKETADLRRELSDLQSSAENLQQQIEALTSGKQTAEKNLEIRTQDLANAAREYRKVVDAYKASQVRLRQLAESQDATVAQKTQELQDQLEQLRNTEAELKAQGEQLRQQAEEQQQRIGELTENLKAEAQKRTQTGNDLLALQAAFENDKSEAADLVREQIKTLQDRIAQMNDREEELRKELDSAKQTIAQRDESLQTAAMEKELTEAHIREIEQRLAGIREEYQTDLKKSLAEIKQINTLNTGVVDELDEMLHSQLNPVVKTALLIEQAENLSPEQRKELAKAGLSCRKLIDTMSYRRELTHIADGADTLAIDRCDLHGLMTDIDRQFSHRAETKKLFFAVSFAQYQAANNVPRHVETDESKIRKILSILLGYAIERTEKGRLGLHTTRRSSSENTANIAFELAYTAKEKPDELLDAVFAETQEEGQVVDVKYGLTLARRFIGMLNGTFELEYRSGGITALTLQFPFRKVASDAVDEPAQDKKEAGAA